MGSIKQFFSDLGVKIAAVGALVVGVLLYYLSLKNKQVNALQAQVDNVSTQKQADVLAYEAVRFSVCATFVNGNDTTWREVQDSDPEDTICQVFDTFTGQYTQCANKTEAFALNDQKKQEIGRAHV